MANYDWNQFTKRITINASVEAIYRAWATQEGLEKWFLRKAEFTGPGKIVRERNTPIQAGDTYEWIWFGHPGSAIERNAILDTNGYDYLRFSFSGNCIVSIRIKKEKEETICELSQSMVPADEKDRSSFYIECGTGWTFYLTNLKSILEGGIDLRNRNEEIKQVINS